MTPITRDELVGAIARLGLTAKQAAAEMGVKPDTIKNAKAHKTWTNGVPPELQDAANAIIVRAQAKGAPPTSNGHGAHPTSNGHDPEPVEAAAGAEPQPVPDAGATSRAAPDDRIALGDLLDGVNKDSSKDDVARARAAAVAEGWPDEEVVAALKAAGAKVATGKKKPATIAASHEGEPVEGLSPGFRFGADGDVEVLVVDAEGLVSCHPVCSHMRALHHISDTGGMGWATDVVVRDKRGQEHTVRLPNKMIQTDALATVRELAGAGLQVHGRAARAVDAIKNATVPLARFATSSGWQMQGKVFVLPDGALGLERGGEVVVWDGGGGVCRTSKGRTLDQWKKEVVARCNGNAVPLTAVGTMLASPAIPFLDRAAEANTMVHFYGNTSQGKTTSLRAAASVWGCGAAVTSPQSFMHSWRMTANASENLLDAHSGIGICLDELASFDAKSAASFAYDFAAGRGKARMQDNTSSREQRGWQLFALSSGEKTLADHAQEARVGGRRKVMEGGAAARIINVPVGQIFTDVHGEPDAKEFAEKLGTASATFYGTAGPAFVEWLIAHQDEARVRLAALRKAWDAHALLVVPPGAAEQARRVASRLGAIAACAALASDVLDLPIAAPSSAGAGLAAPSEAMFWAFSDVLAAWLAKTGTSAVSTEVGELFRDLIDGFHRYPGRFQHATRGQSGDADAGPPPTERLGWIISDQNNVWLFVDVLPGMLTGTLGWNDTQKDRVAEALAKSGFLGRGNGRGLLTYAQRSDGSRPGVYRITPAFFEQ